MWIFTILCITILTIFVFLFSRKTKPTNFWDKYGIPSIDISKLANSFELLFGLKGEVEIDNMVYTKMGSAKFTGIVQSGSPTLVIKDLDLARSVLIKDFDHFVDRHVLFAASHSKVLQSMLPSLSGSKWRGVRVSVSPLFTTGKIRRLMEIFNSCGKEWIASLQQGQIDIKDAAEQFAVDVLAAAVCGLKAGSIQNSNSQFFQESKKLGDTSLLQILRQGLALRFPGIFKLFRMEAMDASSMSFFEDIFLKTLKDRESGRVAPRDDIMQLLLEARENAVKAKGADELDHFEKEALLKETLPGSHLKDDGVLIGQAFIFFLAGIHGVSMDISYAAHALATHPDIQAKLRTEVDAKFEEGEIGYDDVNGLPYMDMFITEILRFYPVTPRLSRICAKEYIRPEIDLKVPAGVTVQIPLAAIHRDPKHFPNPAEFNPENFSQENKAKRHPYAYMPFGHGPRNCIGKRFALVEVKTAVAHLVHNFTLEANKNTFPLQPKLVGQALHIHGHVDIVLKPRK